MKSERIYLDYAASTPVDHKVLEAMTPYFHGRFGNAGSIHFWGQEAQIAIDEARKIVADFLGCAAQEVIFTGSATEADNLAIKGVISKILTHEPFRHGKIKPHIITSSIEHKAILEVCHYLEDKGFIEVSYLPVNKEGIVQIADLEREIKENTVLISIMYANNEIGTIQPIKEIGALVGRINKARSQQSEASSQIIFHTDAVQAVNYLDCDVKKLGVDLLTISGHKIYGPKGVGCLYIKKGTPIEPIIYGGGQEYEMRSGTENIPAIVGLGAAVAEIRNPKSLNGRAHPRPSAVLNPSAGRTRVGLGRALAEIRNNKIKKLRDKLIDKILKKIPEARLNGSKTKRLPNNVNISFKGAEGEAIVIILDQAGVGVSTGSACSAKALTPSHVIMALTGSEEAAHGSVRFSLGKYTTDKEINYVLKILPEIIERLRKISGYQVRK